VGYATVFANRMTYVGELGWELIIPTELTVGVYDLLHENGADLGLADVGYYALESLRLEKAFRAWGRELTPDINPIEAGLSFCVDFEKPSGFLGKESLMAHRALGKNKQRIVQMTIADSDVQLWGGELVLQNGKTVGEVRSAAFGHTLDKNVVLALLRNDSDVSTAMLENGGFQIELGGILVNAVAHLIAAYDPHALRVKSAQG